MAGDYIDEATPTRKAKPAGVRGAQVWVKTGDPAPLDPSELTFLATDAPLSAETPPSAPPI